MDPIEATRIARQYGYRLGIQNGEWVATDQSGRVHRALPLEVSALLRALNTKK